MNKIKYFPPEIVSKMLERQVEQGNPMDVSVFESHPTADKEIWGFDWLLTEEDADFWESVIMDENFDLFFEKCPRGNKTVIIELVSPEAKMPIKFNPTDACWDVYATSREYLYGGKVVKYGLGFKAQLPAGTRLDLRPRSSVYKTGLSLSNCIGTGDEGYGNEYAAFFYNIFPEMPDYEVGDRILQIHVENVLDCKFVEGTISAENVREGFGSTGKK